MTKPFESAPLTGQTPAVPALPRSDGRDIPVIAVDMPIMYEDEGQDEMGESSPHTTADQILSLGLKAHLRSQPQYQVFSNLNVYYHPIDRWAYVSPDVMVVIPTAPLPADLGSYRIGVHGPVPLLMVEILSRRSAQQQDLTNKPVLYAELGVAEYILVDGTGNFLPQRLLLRRLQEDGTWYDEQDADGGVTSQLGFRVILEADNQPRVIDAATEKRYVRPDEAQAALDAEAEARRQAEAARDAEAEARRQAQARLRELEAELKRLRGQAEDDPAG